MERKARTHRPEAKYVTDEAVHFAQLAYSSEGFRTIMQETIIRVENRDSCSGMWSREEDTGAQHRNGKRKELWITDITIIQRLLNLGGIKPSLISFPPSIVKKKK